MAKATYKDLGIRAVSALALSAACIPPSYFGGWVFGGLVAVLGFMLVREWVRSTDPGKAYLRYAIPFSAILASVIFMYFGEAFFSFLAICVAALMAMAERARRGGMLWSGFGTLYLALPCLAILFVRGNEAGFTTPGFKAFIYVVLIVVASDVGAYLGGSTFKGPKIAPRLSPNKTWSGFFSGLAFAMVIAAIVAFVCGFDVARGVLLAVPIVLLGVFGDFFESALKRRLKIKDTGGLLPGHGGFLDRLDSLMAAMMGVAIILALFPAILLG